MMSLVPELKIEFNHYELVHLIDALFDTMIHRLYYAVSPEHTQFRAVVPLESVQRSAESLLALYHRAWAVYQEEKDDEVATEEDLAWQAMRTIPEPVWDLFTAVSEAQSWDEVPSHPAHDECEVCDTFHLAIA